MDDLEKIDRAIGAPLPFSQQGLEADAANVSLKINGESIEFHLLPIGIRSGASVVYSLPALRLQINNFSILSAPSVLICFLCRGTRRAQIAASLRLENNQWTVGFKHYLYSSGGKGVVTIWYLRSLVFNFIVSMTPDFIKINRENYNIN